MKSIFISDNDEIIINFAFAETKDGQIVAETDKATLKQFMQEELVPNSVQEHKAVFKRPSFGDISRMGSDLTTSDGSNLTFDIWKIRNKRMKTLIKSWTLKDGEKEVPATAENIDKLSPALAYIIGVQLDAEIGAQ